ncbi:hypothetical protein N7470_008928 [Penicillium chermesinum]|nr:hypothetical protein N7470_008928 [Penicillium chermesinum]
MNSSLRQASGTSGKTKRRYTDPNDDGKMNAPDDATIQPKRQRVSRACDSCRSKKDKCDGVQPVCSTCAQLSRPCTYKANPKKRGLPTGYIRSLELLWGLVFQRIRGSEDVMRALMRSINLPSHLATMNKETEGSDTLMASFKNSAVLKDIEQILVTLDQPEEQRERNIQAYSDEDTPFDVDEILASADAHEWHVPDELGQRETPFSAILPPARTSTIAGTPKRASASQMQDAGVQADTSHETQPHNNILSSGTDNRMEFSSSRPLQLPYNAWPLLDIYFSYTQCWFPILEKHDILRTAFQYTESDVYVASTSSGSGNHAALWAVLTLASLQDASIPVPRGSHTEGKINSLQFYNTARDLVPSENGPYEVGHVQALLILSLVKFGQQEWTPAWMLPPSSSKPQEQSKPAQQAQRAKHVFLGCFVLETLIAEQTSQCPSLRKDDLVAVGAIDEDGLEEWHPWEDQAGLRPSQSSRASMQRGPLHALSTFNRLISLIAILNDLCYYKRDPTVSRSELELLEAHLQRWATTLPKSYRVDLQSRPLKSPSPHIFGLEMTYQSIVSTLSLQIAERERDQNIPEKPHESLANESCRRAIQLAQLYLDTYSSAAAPPTFGTILKFCIPKRSARRHISDLEIALRNKVQSISSHLGQIFCLPDRAYGDERAQPIVLSPTAQHHGLTRTNDPGLTQESQRMATSRHLHISATHAFNHPATTPDAFLSAPWLRAPQSIDDVSLFSTPAPSLTTVGGTSEDSVQQAQFDGSLGNGLRHNTSAPPKSHAGPNMMPALSQPFSAEDQYPTHQGTSFGLSTFVDMDGYVPPRRQQRIAPDLDALFDELASLDGADKADNAPEFMQNLGFVANSSIPEMYSSSQIEPFLLAQTQQVPGNGSSSGTERDSQQLSMVDPSNR